MNTRTCKCCGWIYPIGQTGRRCKICGQEFDEIFCKSCKQLLPVSAFEKTRSICKKCRRPYLNAFWDNHLASLDEAFNAWLEKVRRVPKSYPTLTEEQWLEACRYFDGCARCHSDDIEARGFFVGAKLGGRYCNWNVIPLCEKCASNWDLELNMFRYAEQRDHRSSTTEYRECLARIVEYLGGKLDDAIGTEE